MGKTDRNKVEREKKAASLCQGGGLSLVSFTFFCWKWNLLHYARECRCISFDPWVRILERYDVCRRRGGKSENKCTWSIDMSWMKYVTYVVKKKIGRSAIPRCLEELIIVWIITCNRTKGLSVMIQGHNLLEAAGAGPSATASSDFHNNGTADGVSACSLADIVLWLWTTKEHGCIFLYNMTGGFGHLLPTGKF